MDDLITALFLSLRLVRMLIKTIGPSGPISQVTVSLFDQMVQTLETDCANGNYDMSLVDKAVEESFDPSRARAQDQYHNTD